MSRLLRVKLKLYLHLNLYYPKIHNFQIVQYLVHNGTNIEELNKKQRG
jgi:hypothetical protein